LLYWQALTGPWISRWPPMSRCFTLGGDVGSMVAATRQKACMQNMGMRVRDTPISGTASPDWVSVLPCWVLRRGRDHDHHFCCWRWIDHQRAARFHSCRGQFKMPLVVRVPGGVARQLGAQHAQRLGDTLMNVPGLRIEYRPRAGRLCNFVRRSPVTSDHCSGT